MKKQDLTANLTSMQAIADAIIKPNQIECRPIQNHSCLKCGLVQMQMVKVGAFSMCQTCWSDEFGVDSFGTESNHMQIYRKWMDKYRKL